jgi:hypothetical protein
MANMANDLVEQNFECSCCLYITSREDQYMRHLLTAKHKRQIMANDLVVTDQIFSCECGKIYKHLCSLCKHRKKCNFHKKPNDCIIKSPNLVDCSNNAIMVELLKQNHTIMLENKELKTLIIDLASKVGNNNNNNTINNTINNNSFNLNFFLNETCKDAININEFIQNIEIQLKELENVGNNGYITGITDIIVSRLKQLDITKRPVHCTDIKRETLYIKDQNAWNKDTNDNEKMRNVVTKVAKKNLGTIPRWREANPECNDPENEKYSFCINMMRNSLGELGDEQTKIDDKVIKNVAKLVIVDKNTTN